MDGPYKVAFIGLELCISINASLIASARGQSRAKSGKSRVCHSEGAALVEAASHEREPNCSFLLMTR